MSFRFKPVLGVIRSFRFHRADIFFAFKARSMSVSFRGQQRADDEGIRQGSTPIKYAVKQEDFIGGEGFGGVRP